MTLRLTRRRLLLAGGGAATLLGVGTALHAAGNLPGDFMTDVNSIDLSSIDAIHESTWAALAQRRIYFGHQSVGYGLVAGLEDIRRAKRQVRLDVVETTDLTTLQGPAFAHSPVGANQDPSSKIRDFARRIDAAGTRGVDIAFFKFCYVDVTAATPLQEVFRDYHDTMARLERTHPKTRFGHVTVPLTTPESGIKAGVKRVLGKRPWGHDDNLARDGFNAMLREAYRGQRPFIDLARAESTLPDGRPATLSAGGATGPILARCYSDDGGHLNEAGRVVAACALLRALAEAST